MLKQFAGKIINSLFPSRKYRKYKSAHCTIGKDVSISESTLGEYSAFAHHASVTLSRIGKRTSVGRYSIITDSQIGTYCSISWFVTIGARSHPLERATSHAFTYRKQFALVDKDAELNHPKTVIGNDVWIGANAVIRGGVNVGDGAVIGAGAVVTHDVEPYAIVGGVPAKVIGYRFDEKTRERLLQIKWWDFPDDILRKNTGLFSKPLDDDVLQKLETLRKSL